MTDWRRSDDPDPDTVSAMALDQASASSRERFVDYRRTGERCDRDELIEAHLRLAEHLARRFANRGVALDDLIQVASLGLVKAVERFEPDRGLEFSTFATPTIVGELKRHFRDKGWAVRVPRRVQELHVELNTLVGELTQRLGRSPTISRAGPAWPARPRRRCSRRWRRRRPTARRRSTRRVGDSDEEPRASPSSSATRTPTCSTPRTGSLITSLLTTLPRREQLMLRLRFYEGMTQSQIADRLGISQMHVSRLLTKSLALLRDRVEHADGT